jgi:hypothetical protein
VTAVGLLRGIARTAVVAGTATAVSNRVSRRQAGRWARQDEEYAGSEPAGPADDAAEADEMTVRLEQLKQLAELHDQGVLTDAELERQKAQILGT